MIKKFLIISLCVCCFLSLFNLGGNWNYEGLKTAAERIGDESSFLPTTYNKVVLLFDIIPARFSLDLANGDVLYLEKWTNSSSGFYGIYFGVGRRHGGGGRPFGDDNILDNNIHGGDGRPFGDVPEPEEDVFVSYEDYLFDGGTLVVFSTLEERDKVFEELVPMIGVPPYHSDSPFAEVISVLGTFVYSFMVVFTIIEILVVSVIDFFRLVFALIGSCFYLLFG